MKNFLNSLLAFLTGIFIISLFIFFTNGKQFDVLWVFLFKPFYSWLYFGNMLNMTGLLLFAGLGATFAFKTGNFNLGGEGLIYLAGFLTAILFQYRWGIPSPVQFFLVFIIVVSSGLCIGLFSGVLKAFFKINELLSSFLISAASLPILDYCILEVMKKNNSSLLATSVIDEAFQIKAFLPPALLNSSFFFALVLAVLLQFFFYATFFGYRLRITGQAKEFGLASGFSVKSPSLVGMAVSGALFSMTGFFAVTGTWYVCHLGFSSGMGWAGLSIALIARKNIIAVIVASFFYAWIKAASDAAIMSAGFSFDTAIFLQASIFLLISVSLIKNTRFLHLKKKKSKIPVNVDR